MLLKYKQSPNITVSDNLWETSIDIQGMNHWQHPFIVQKAPIYKRKSRFDRDKLLTILSLF